MNTQNIQTPANVSVSVNSHNHEIALKLGKMFPDLSIGERIDGHGKPTLFACMNDNSDTIKWNGKPLSDYADQGNQVITCMDTQIIIHPLLHEYIARHHNYYLDGHRVNVYRSKSMYYHFSTRVFRQHLPYITPSNIDNYFVLDDKTGEIFPIFLAVPCNHCAICRHRKVSEFSSRCRLESISYDCNPWFVTLTYNNVYLPSDGSLSIYDVQKFLKRLRINLERAGYSRHIRYVCCGEYGPAHLRPHYHMIIWNLKPSKCSDGETWIEYKDFKDILDRSWNMGFTYSRLIDLTKSDKDKTAEYTSKYLAKIGYTPLHAAAPFIVSSNRGGGIGSRVIDAKKNTLLDNNQHMKYLNRFLSKVENIPMTKYVLDRSLPSFSRSVPYPLRLAWRKFVEFYSCSPDELQEYFRAPYERLMRVFSPHLPTFCPSLDDLSEDYMLTYVYPGTKKNIKASEPISLRNTDPLAYIVFCQMALEQYIDYLQKYIDYDFDRAHDLDTARRVYLAKYSNRQQKDLIDIAHKQIRSEKRRKSTETYDKI